MAAVEFEDDGRFDGINDRSQLAAAEWSLRVRLNEAHMTNGVTMRDPSTVYLDWTVELGADVTLEPNVILRGATSVGDGSVIGAGSQLVDATIGRRAQVWASVIESSTVEDGATVGPFSHLRPGSVVGAGAEVGNYRRAQEHAPRGRLEAAPHELPRRRARSAPGANIGAGAITANYDGSAQAPDDDRRGGVHRRRHHARRPGRRSATGRGPGPARS